MALQGIRLRDLVALAAPDAGATTLHITALDDYQIDLNLADVRADDIFLATRNGQGLALPVEDGGPTRVVFADALSPRFSPDMWIWNIETIEVR
jgi:DMSO/TMAO reductase YedYZ molybdopterin-dependent catalytic subunit